MVGSAITGSTTSSVGGSSAVSAILQIEAVLAVEAGEVKAETDPAARRRDAIFMLVWRDKL